MNRNKLERTTFARDAYTAIREMLLEEGRFLAGEKISVEALSRDLAVSRSPVWGAISRLEAEGLLHVVPRQGVFVIAFDASKVIAIFEAREALEGMAARLAASRMTPEDREIMAEALSRQARSIEAEDPVAYQASNLDFHHRLLVAAQNATIEASLKSLYAQTQAMCNGRNSFSEGWGQLRQNLAEHQRVLDMLTAHDQDAAEQAARLHVQQLLKAILTRESQAAVPSKAPM
ncbi:GntR family transcriptional regulator [Pandoraea terrigena]|uniref:Pyruvate dehydrogenase complex repressor n=1 Tax=Pandoraea terrigena TaxID=2508292 RepID=A0A5E4T543_9BURK|nr:GntR family transcriptional regulator [Pandoraea terrigena]VVD82541.1 Pyruvate dehydrogenase complex repressor [Pandoraea terrigena]